MTISSIGLDFILLIFLHTILIKILTGGNWPATVALWLVEGLTWKSCDGGPGDCGSTAETEVRAIYTEG